MSECKRCGNCCKSVSLKINANFSDDVLRWLSFHNLKTDGKWLYIPLKCKFYKEGYGCTIYRIRPDVCKNYSCELSENPFKEVKPSAN